MLHSCVLKQPIQQGCTRASTAAISNLPPGDVGFHQSQHVDGRLIQLDEHSIVDLPQSEELQDLPHTWTHAIDTTIGRIHQVMYRNYRCMCIPLSLSERARVCGKLE